MKLTYFSLAFVAAVSACKKDGNCPVAIPFQSVCENTDCTSYGGNWQCPANSLTTVTEFNLANCRCECCSANQVCRIVDGAYEGGSDEICRCGCDPISGPRGAAGCVGSQGPNGEDAIDGVDGIPGKNAYHGKPGYGGNHGDDGNDMPSGNDGDDGQNGPLGVVGKNGEQGAPGDNGRPGRPGPSGAPGPFGPAGPAGDAGRPGPGGPPGPRGKGGKRGPAGGKGRPGPRGGPGPRGEDGEDGDMGPIGAAGRPGNRGAPGARGAPGTKGPNGATGAVGAEGPVGAAGANGRDSNMKGHPGAPGDNGAAGINGDDAEWDWAYIEVMIANTLWSELREPSEYCAEDVTESCACGKRVDIPDGPKPKPKRPVVTQPPPAKPVRDLIFLVDGSDSVSEQDWPVFKNWLSKFIVSLNQDESMKQKYSMQSATVVVQYSSHGLKGDNNSGYVVKKALLDELNTLKQETEAMIQLSAGTDTFLALEFIVDDLIPNQIENVRSGNSGVAHTRELILITHGSAHDFNGNSYFERQYSNSELLNKLSSTFEHRFVVGIGSEISESYNDRVASVADGEMTFYTIEDWNQLDDDLQYEIIQIMNNNENSYLTDDSWNQNWIVY